MTTYAQLAELPINEKIVLATIEAAQLAKTFTVHSGSVYYRDVDYFVSKVKQGSITLTENTSTSLSASQFYFDKTAKRLYIRTTDSSNPNTKQITIFYKFFYSNAPLILPYNLTTGKDVEWESRIDQTGSINQSLDSENTGIAIEVNTSISLIGNDGYFDEIFDTLIWENKEINIYSWIYGLPITEAKKIFSGIVTEKSFTPDKTTFRAKDFTFKLREFLNLDLFTSNDGTLSDSDIDTPKRRIYGRVKQAKCIGIDKILDGYDVGLTATGNSGNSTITLSASGTSKIYQGDDFSIELPNGDIEEFTIDAISSTTIFTIGENLELSFSDAPLKIKPTNGYKAANRDWHIAGHKLFEKTYNINAVISPRRFQLDSVIGLYADDIVEINGDYVKIKSVSADSIVTYTNVSPEPLVNDSVNKIPIQQAYLNNKKLVVGRDYTYTNTTECILSLTTSAEFNLAKPRALSDVTLTFTNASRTVAVATGTVDLRTVLKPKDWIKIDNINHTTYYEILLVTESSLRLNATFGYTTAAYSCIYKNVELVNDDSLITVDCYGLMDGLDWLKTPSQCVQHILETDAGLTGINQDTFDQASVDGDFITSIILPESTGSTYPQIRDTITKINQSCFGSLYTDNDFNLAYSILNSEKPDGLGSLEDHDIISFSSNSRSDLANKIIIKYRPFIDINSGEDTFEQTNYTLEFTSNVVETSITKELICYLYEDDVADMIAERYCLFKSLTNQEVKIKGKLNLATKVLNDKIWLSLDRLYKRFGGGDKKKIGIISGISKNGYDVEITLNDLGNIFNRVPSIAPDDQVDYSSASEDEVLQYGFVLDDTTETPTGNNDEMLGNGLIG